jgi:hypothetical protein
MSVSGHKPVPNATRSQMPGVLHAPAKATPISTPSAPNPPNPPNPPKRNGGKKKKGSKPVNEWSPAEDQRLVDIVQTMRPVRWKQVALHFSNRSDYACEKRFEKVS